MRLNTTKRYTQLAFIYIVLALLLIFDVAQGQIGGFDSGALLFTPYVIVAVVFFAYRGNPVFIYDSDGEVIIINTREPSLASFSKMFAKQYEFPKRKLKGYTISNLPFRRTLTLKVESKEDRTKVVRASISYINRHEVKDLERSLRGILSKNKKMREAQENE
jgi:hypothetical protein